MPFATYVGDGVNYTVRFPERNVIFFPNVKMKVNEEEVRELEQYNGTFKIEGVLEPSKPVTVPDVPKVEVSKEPEPIAEKPKVKKGKKEPVPDLLDDDDGIDLVPKQVVKAQPLPTPTGDMPEDDGI